MFLIIEYKFMLYSIQNIYGVRVKKTGISDSFLFLYMPGKPSSPLHTMPLFTAKVVKVKTQWRERYSWLAVNYAF
jgi:hypothetical protein